MKKQIIAIGGAALPPAVQSEMDLSLTHFDHTPRKAREEIMLGNRNCAAHSATAYEA